MDLDDAVVVMELQHELRKKQTHLAHTFLCVNVVDAQNRENTFHDWENTTHSREHISNNIPIPITYPKNGWGKPNTWLAGQPAR